MKLIIYRVIYYLLYFYKNVKLQYFKYYFLEP